MTFFNFILIIHIICGFTAFIVAPIAMAVKKGSAAHRKWGKIFFWAMCGVCAAALIMAPMHKNLFLTLVAVFSFYMAFSGYRVLYRKNLQNWRQVAFIDWFVVSINALFSLALIYLGIKTINSAFGVISLVSVFSDCLTVCVISFHLFNPQNRKANGFSVIWEA
ncbi:MAG: hypothetical protein IPQ03_15040 [Bacteroidetes bacterium]|nr:hypothetical protein [Bacteroidota bacterium]